ncbi:hypothetical protein KIL84_022274 [Mauremys mutica]|uniref:Uncharacterized protein n=1 Tax=Mauremys mutica TaxID=74926 RepID=A0A9D3X5I8_9SAUR|nr:hypothetical protein KIL84_022274 [Mauremys mutica]
MSCLANSQPLRCVHTAVRGEIASCGDRPERALIQLVQVPIVAKLQQQGLRHRLAAWAILTSAHLDKVSEQPLLQG